MLLDPKLDVVFKLLFARPANALLLRSMIEAVIELPRPIAAITVLNPELPRDLAALKVIVLDVCVRLDDGTLIDIEMETSPRPALASRVVYYWARMFAGQLERGGDYTELRRAISVVWLNGSIPPVGARFHSTFHIAEVHTHAPLTDQLEVHVIALPKLARQSAHEAPRPALERWARFFLAADADSLHAVAMEDPVMSKAVEELTRLSQDPDAQRLVDEVELARRVHGHMLAAAKREGREEGREEGQQEGRTAATHAIAQSLLTAGFSVERVAELTGLAPDTLRDLTPPTHG